MGDVATGKGAYPVDLEQDVPLADGRIVHLRAIRADDVGRLQAFHGRLSRDSIFFRFFSPLPVLTDERAAYFTTLDYDQRLAIVAVERPASTAQHDGTLGDGAQAGGEQIIGVIRYDRAADPAGPADPTDPADPADPAGPADPADPADPAGATAEFALIVEDRYQRHGIGSVLFWALVKAARARGIRTLTADVLAENRRMLQMLRRTGLPSTTRRAGNAIRIELDLVSEAGPRPAT
jgi:GNAT superfamily N-acetyltransferase